MKTQKCSLIAVLAAAGLIALSGTARAEDTNASSQKTPPSRGAEGRPNMRGGNVDQRVDRMAERLKLTDEQKAKVKALLQADAEKMRGLRDLAPEERRDKMRAMRKETDAKMKNILTADQFKQWQEIRQNARGGNRGNGANAKKPPQS